MNIENIIRIVKVLAPISQDTEYAIRAAYKLDAAEEEPIPLSVIMGDTAPDMTSGCIGELRDKMRSKRLSKSTVAKKLGVHISTVSGWIKRGSASPDSVAKIQQFLSNS
jgi:DNA-binding transcriptional regulator YiaG